MHTYTAYLMTRTTLPGSTITRDVPLDTLQAASLVDAMQVAKKRWPQHAKDLAVARSL